METNEYAGFDAVGLARLVARGEVTAEDLLDAALTRMEAVNPKINAVIVDLADEARAAVRAGLPPGPLRGVPFLIKDISTQMRGVPTRAGAALLRDIPPAASDSALVAAYRASGLVLFGKTNTPEFGLQPVTEPMLFGATRNPWDLDRSPGGSSGGSAAAVAAGIAPAAQASDGGGSIRIPASCCGLFGLKPSRGRVSMAPGGEGWGGLSVLHALTRSVRDSAALLDVGSRPQPGDPNLYAAPERPFAEEVGRDPGRLRVAFHRGALMTGLASTEVSFAVDEAAKLCADLGHDVEETELPFEFAFGSMAGGVLVATSIVSYIDGEAERRGRPVEEHEVEALTWRLYQQGKTHSAYDYGRAIAMIHRLGRALGAFFERYDVLLTSTLGTPPLRIGELSSTSANGEAYYRVFAAYMPNTQAFNHTGQPAMSMPLAWTDEGLPVGVQFATKIGGEGLLLRLAGQLEAARPWADRRPPLG
ncbi:MAG TPA: amidase [Caulobacteraceae bacterium]|nr:amidase [Caulobacteraceae bacterium]